MRQTHAERMAAAISASDRTFQRRLELRDRAEKAAATKAMSKRAKERAGRDLAKRLAESRRIRRSNAAQRSGPAVLGPHKVAWARRAEIIKVADALVESQGNDRRADTMIEALLVGGRKRNAFLARRTAREVFAGVAEVPYTSSTDHSAHLMRRVLGARWRYTIEEGDNGVFKAILTRIRNGLIDAQQTALHHAPQMALLVATLAAKVNYDHGRRTK